jgi:peptidoglycan/LPS O-acetylase OafA/YrhL
MQTVNNISTKIKYPSLNGLRAISIFFVIFNHLSIQNAVPEEVSKYKLLQPIINLICDGELGVNIFFVISGFLITALLLEENRKKQTISLRNFYIRRTLRIFPAYYFYLLVLYILQIASVIHIGSSSWLSAVTYTKYFNWKLEWFTAHAWSLSIEEHFYLFWPLLFLLGDKVRKRTAVFFVLLVPIIKLCLYYHPVLWINDLTIFKRIDAIAMGCLIALYKDELLKIFKPRFRGLFYMSVLGLYFLIYLPPINVKLHLHLDFIIMLLASTYGTMANVFIGIILLYAVFGHQGLWFRLLNSKILNYIGILSYSLYLWQQVFISGLKYWVTSFPQNVIFVFVTAIFSYYCIEQPFLKIKEKF